MAAPEEPPAPLGLAAGRSLVQVACAKGRLLAVQPDHTLRFVRPGAEDATALWVLAALADRAGAAAGAAGRYVLQSAAGGGYISAAGGQLRCTSEPTTLQIYLDMNRGAVLGLGGRACLQAAPGGAAAVGQLPLGRDRASKLFALREAGLPLHSLQAWPLRAALRCEAVGGGAAAGYLSAGSGGALSVGAPVACCSEEFLLAPGEAAPLRVQAGSLVAPGCRLWDGHGRRQLSTEPLTGRVLLAAQHACTGHERFTLHLACTGQVRLLAEAAAAADVNSSRGCCGSSIGGAGSSSSEERITLGGRAGCSSRDGLCGGSGSSALVPAIVRQGMLLATGSGSGDIGACAAGKPAAFALELASAKPTLLLTAHSHLVSCKAPAGGGAARPAGVLMPARGSVAASATAAAAGGTSCGPFLPAVERCAWVLQHHGDSVYSLRHALTGQTLYICDDGAPCLDPPGGRVVHPDERLLFWIEPGWVTLSAASGSEGAGGAERSASGGCSAAGAGLSSAAQPEVAGFVQPNPGSCRGGGSNGGSGCVSGAGGSDCGALTAAGFAIRSVRRVGGRHVRLCALPDGLLTTVHAAGPPSRWELFQLADLQTLLDSPLGLAQRLPCDGAATAAAVAAGTAAAPLSQVSLRRAASMQALGSGDVGGCASRSSSSRGSGECLRSPSLPTVQEQGDAEGPASLPPVERGCGALQPLPAAAAPQHAGLPPRRCQSESALAALEQQRRWHGRAEGCGGGARPLWLAQQLQPPPEQRGWGASSPAPLQDLACRQLCASLAAEYGRQHGSGCPPAGLAEAVEAELSTHLPEELCTRIARDLRLLLEPPAPTKLSLHRLCKAAAAQPKDVPAWALPHLPAEGEALSLQWQPTEAFVCARCRGASGALLPLDPYTNPAHHLFLHAMERAARGGGRTRIRGRRRLEEGDLLIRALRAGKLLLLAWAAGRALGAVRLGRGGGGGGQHIRTSASGPL